LEAAFRRVGVLRVHSIGDLFDMAEVLSKQPRPEGPRLTIITNAGGPGVLATDTLIGGGGQLATLPPAVVEALNRILPPAWSHANPIDVLGDAPPDRYAQTLNVAAQNPDGDGLLVILTPQAMTDPVMTAEKLRPLARSLGKPVLATGELDGRQQRGGGARDPLRRGDPGLRISGPGRGGVSLHVAIQL
jgi:acetyltransferase